MSTQAATTAISAKAANFDEWMLRVIARAAKARDGFDVDDVHDLRVAIRRCRTMAEVLSEVNPNPGWRRLKKASSPMFKSLGELRDVQVMAELVKQIAPHHDRARHQLLRTLSNREKRCRADAADAIDHFDRKLWKRLAHKLGPKARFFPLESVVFQRLALARLNDASRLYRVARRKSSSKSWHRLRIAIKRFRYVVENFLPRRYELWADELKQLQDALGELHDLDVLRATIRNDGSRLDSTSLGLWLQKIDARRKFLLSEINSKLSGSQSLLMTWRAGLPLRHALFVAPAAPRQRRTA
jgi:CHAD domain-containing protein